jgi:CubicO group peptidase (beta-lactamase class C family)
MKRTQLHFVFSATLSLLLLVVGNQTQTSAQNKLPSIPDTPAGRRLSDWLRFYKSGDFDAIRNFMTASYAKTLLEQAPADFRASYLVGASHANGELKIIAIEKSSDNEIVALAESKLTELQSRVTVRVAPEEPHIITAISNAPIRPVNARKMSQTEFAHWLDSYLKRLVTADVFSGSVLVVKDGKPIFQNAYGLASKAYNVPNRIDTKFNLGSMNKMITGVAIAQLVEQGKLSFDDTVGKILPDYANKEIAEKVKIHHLLTHTSGLADYFTQKFFETSKERYKAVKDYLPLFVDKPLLFQPGERMSYSNAGFMLLGVIIEKVSGQDYFSYVREHIYKPAGMNDTDAYELDHDTPNLAVGYTNENEDGRFIPGPRANNLFRHVVKGGPAGGGFSTAPDLLKFANALIGHKLLSQHYTDIVTAGKVAAGPGLKYGYGFFCAEVNGGRTIGHSGGFSGINSQLDIHLDTGYMIIVMSNYDPPIAQQIVTKIGQIIPED